MRLENKSAFITGASSGMGRAGAVRFSREGAVLGLVDIDGEGLRDTQKLVADAGGRALLFVGDVTDRTFLADAIKETASVYGALDILYNNAGWQGENINYTDISDHLWNRVLAVNLTAVHIACQTTIPLMISQGKGSIINISSINALVGRTLYHAYTAAKGGVIALTRTIAATYANKGIRANVICPGAIRTPLMDRLLAESSDPDAKLKEFSDNLPVKRVGRPEEVAALAVYFASDESAFTTGTVLAVDGGLTLV